MAKARYAKQWKADQVRGLGKRTTGPARAQAHVQGLTSQYGVSVRAIAEAAGIGAAVISQLNRGVCQGLKVTTERRILTVRMEDIYNRPSARGSVPAIGARRRIQALMVMGWRHQDLTPRLGFLTTNLIHQAGDWISKQKHEAVKDLYHRLWNVRGPAGRQSLARVAKAGYAPPLAWDDDTIDDPNAAPGPYNTTAQQGLQKRHYANADSIVEDVEFLLSSGSTWHELLTRLGTTHEALDRALHRAARPDLINRAKTMTERLAFARAS